MLRRPISALLTAALVAVCAPACLSTRSPGSSAPSPARPSLPPADVPVPGSPAQTPTASASDTPRPPAKPSPTPDYRLPIVGSSAAITGKAWTNMLSWRKRIAEFSKEHPDRVVLNGPDRPRVALTFDDGPDDRNTLSVKETLDRYGVKGSFFLIGEYVRQYPDVAKKLADDGHLVLSHADRHVELTKAGEDEVKASLRDAAAEIKRAIGREPAWLRPPYGETDERVVQAAASIGSGIALWSLDSLDWSQTEPEPIVQNVLDHVRNGDIILLHSGKDNAVTAKALPSLIEGLQAAGYELVDLAALLDRPAYLE